MTAEKRVPILMTENTRGGLDGIHNLLFQEGKVYMANVSLARQFIEMEVAVISIVPQAGAYNMIFHEGKKPTWRLMQPQE